MSKHSQAADSLQRLLDTTALIELADRRARQLTSMSDELRTLVAQLRERQLGTGEENDESQRSAD